MKKLLLGLIGLAMVQYSSLAQSCCQFGGNLITNGDFESLGATIPTTYNYNVPSFTSGDYGIVTTANSMLGGFIDCPTFSDHTAAGTRYAIFNQSGPATTTLLNYSTIPVTPGETYTFKYFVNPDFAGNSYNFNLTVFINGSSVLVSNMNVYPTGCVWREVCVQWTAPAMVTTATINLGYSSGGGNHSFGLDDISFRETLQVEATQPVLNICDTEPPFYLGVKYLPTGNVYHTNGHFTPVDGYPGGIGPLPGGSYTSLPPVTTTVVFGSYEIITFDPSIGPGTYTVEYTYTDIIGGCSESATMTINVSSAPVVVATQPTVTLCSADDPVNIGVRYLPNGNIYSTFGFFTPEDGFSPSIPPIGGSFTYLPPAVTASTFPPYTLFQFDPSIVPPGTYPVAYSYTDPLTGCSDSDTMNFVVTGEQWHQTTSNTVSFANKGDKGFDIFTDDDGFVFATGSFQKETTFDDGLGNSITISSAQPDLNNFYTVCHNACGELQWVIYDAFGGIGDNWSEGFGINKQDDEILIGFNYNRETELITVYPNGTTIGSTFNGSLGGSSIGHLAVIAVDGANTATFGEVNAIEDSYENHFGTALDVQDYGSVVNVYISGKSDNDANSQSNVFASKLRYDISSNTFVVDWMNNSIQESSVNVANDIKWDAQLNGVLITGTFDHTLTMNASTITAGALRDAFFAWLDPSTGNVFFNNLHAFGASVGEYAEGNCLTSDDDGHVYFGGDYTGDVSNVFGSFLGGAGALGYNSVSNSSYLFSYEISSTSLEAEEIFNTYSYAHLTGMDANTNELCFVGYYDRGLPEITGTTSQATLNAIGGPWRYSFVGEAKIGTGNWNNPTIVNSTKDINSPAVKYDHISSRVSISADYAFITGTYKGNLDYYNGAPVSGVLLSSGTNLDPYNAFILRQDIASNELRTPLQENDGLNTMENPILQLNNEESSELIISAYPNPTNGMLTISINGYDFQETPSLQVLNLQGQIVLENQLVTAQEIIDLSQFENGIYLVRINVNGQIKSIRITKS